MQPLIELILQGLEPKNVEEFEDDRPSWQKKSEKIPFVKFRAEVRRIPARELVEKIIKALASQAQGFVHAESRCIEGSDIWHIFIHHKSESARFLVSIDGASVSVSKLPPGCG